jgi:hypothetical protein
MAKKATWRHHYKMTLDSSVTRWNDRRRAIWRYYYKVTLGPSVKHWNDTEGDIWPVFGAKLAITQRTFF